MVHTKVTLEWPENAAAWYYRFKLRGQPRQYKTTHEGDVRKARKVAEAAVEKASTLQHFKSQNLPIASAVDQYCTAKWPTAEGTYYSDAHNRLERFAAFRAIDLAASTRDEVIGLIQDYLEHRAKTVGPVSVNNDQRALSKFCVWLGKRRPPMVPWKGNPASAENLELPSVPKNAKKPLNKAQQRELLAAGKGTAAWLPIILALGAGLRAAEIGRSEWDHIDFDQGLMTVQGKRGRQRVIPLATGVLSALKPLKKDSGPICYSVRSDSLCDALAALRKAVWPKIKDGEVIGDLRPTFTMQFLRVTAAFRISREVDIMTYARIMGHSLVVAQHHYLDFDTMAAWGRGEMLSPNEWETEQSEKTSESERVDL